MAQYGSGAATFKVGVNFMTQYITGSIDIEKAAETEDGTPVGATISRELFVGITTLSEFTVSGPYDDAAATGPDAVFGGGLGTSSAVEVLYGGTKKTTVTLGIKKYKRVIDKGKLTGYEATFVNTGATIVEV